MASILTKIITGVINTWDVAEAAIEKEWSAVTGKLPSSALPDAGATLSVLKQDASDAISAAASAEATYAPALAKTLESAADGALAVLLGGYSVPLIPLTNAGIDKIVSTGSAVLQSWAVSAKAGLAPATPTVTQAPTTQPITASVPLQSAPPGA